MTILKFAAITLAILGLAAALNAARLWWKASRTSISSSAPSISDVPELHILNARVAFNVSSELNSHAAIWTGLSAVLSAAASMCGVV